MELKKNHRSRGKLSFTLMKLTLLQIQVRNSYDWGDRNKFVIRLEEKGKYKLMEFSRIC